jgi:hypothetical protein
MPLLKELTPSFIDKRLGFSEPVHLNNTSFQYVFTG